MHAHILNKLFKISFYKLLFPAANTPHYSTRKKKRFGKKKFPFGLGFRVLIYLINYYVNYLNYLIVKEP